jgi:hypothetical protein
LRHAPQLATLRLLGDSDEVRFPLEWLKADEAEYAAHVEERPNLEEFQDHSKPEWTCARCHERVPSNFKSVGIARRPKVAMRHLTIVGEVRDAWFVWLRGRGRGVCARVACPA